MNSKILGGMLFVVLVISGAAFLRRPEPAQADLFKNGIPKFEVDPSWPKDLPNQWMMGQVAGIFVDSHDHVWVTNRPRSLEDHDKYAAFDPPQADCCKPAPAVLEFDADGNFVQGWGGPGAGYEWPDNEHGMFVDYKENVWVGGNGMKDTNILKFTKDGKFLLQIGHHGTTGGSNDTENLNRPAGFVVYPKTNEVFVADGYGNRRVIVFDADTGAYKRHWGAYGKKPDDKESNARTFEGDGPKQFNTVHSLRISNDDLVYVGDRRNNRIQVFKPDGTYLKEAPTSSGKPPARKVRRSISRILAGPAAAIHLYSRRNRQQEGPDSELTRQTARVWWELSAVMAGMELRRSSSIFTASRRIRRVISIWVSRSENAR